MLLTGLVCYIYLLFSHPCVSELHLVEWLCFTILKDSFCALQHWVISLMHFSCLPQVCIFRWECLKEDLVLGGCLFVVCLSSCVKMFSLSVYILGCLPDWEQINNKSNNRATYQHNQVSQCCCHAQKPKQHCIHWTLSQNCSYSYKPSNYLVFRHRVSQPCSHSQKLKYLLHNTFMWDLDGLVGA